MRLGDHDREGRPVVLPLYPGSNSTDLIILLEGLLCFPSILDLLLICAQRASEHSKVG